MDYYNEIDGYAAGWLRNLQAAGQLPAGRVDERSIADVRAEDLLGARQAHFFAGIGGWPLALQLAGWGSEPVWTGSCPCQPFSVAGNRKAAKDERHLWPEFRRLISECRPPVVFGEQVASRLGREWLAGVQTDLEGLGYAVGRADLCAAGVGAPHIRQRLYWVADQGERWNGRQDSAGTPGFPGSQDGGRLGDSRGDVVGRECRGASGEEAQGNSERLQNGFGRVLPGSASSTGGLAYSHGGEPRNGGLQPGWEHGQQSEDDLLGGLGDSERGGRQGGAEQRRGAEAIVSPEADRNGFWSQYELVTCTDGKARRIEPGTFPLAHGVPCRVGKLRAYGNAIAPPLAAVFIRAYLELRRA